MSSSPALPQVDGSYKLSKCMCLYVYTCRYGYRYTRQI